MPTSDSVSSGNTIAWFISPHGFGHAARACAVMEALWQSDPSLVFHIYTQVPDWFFSESLSAPYTYQSLLSDIGLVQITATEEDLPETMRRLDAFLPFTDELLDTLAAGLLAKGCRLVVCDIAPLGIAAAHRAGLPAVLVENFTWDWIYTGYLPLEPRLAGKIEYLEEWFSAADYYIQTEPVCKPAANASLVTAPVSRRPRTTTADTRRRLGIGTSLRMALISMGGAAAMPAFLQSLPASDGTILVVPGGHSGNRLQREGNRIWLPFHSDFFHPDLVAAADVVVGKAGYSTVAEAYHAGVPFAFVPRPRFRESAVLAAFIEQQMGGVRLDEEALVSGSWLKHIQPLFEFSHSPPGRPNGAEQAAAFLLDL